MIHPRDLMTSAALFDTGLPQATHTPDERRRGDELMLAWAAEDAAGVLDLDERVRIR